MKGMSWINPKLKSIGTLASVVVLSCMVTLLTASAMTGDKKPSPARTAVYADMEATLGLVPSFMQCIPDDETLRMEWELMNNVQMKPGPIPNKYRELIGVAVSAATKCRYCAYFHTEFARLNGATDAEIEDALHYTKSTTGWSTYINGSQLDYDQFKAEVDAIVKHVQSQSAAENNPAME